MKREQKLDWKMKKNIVLTACALVLTITMGISLAGQSSNTEKMLISQEDYVEGKTKQETTSGTSLYMGNSVVEEATLQTENSSKDKSAIAKENAVEGKELAKQSKEKEHIDVSQTVGQKPAAKDVVEGPKKTSAGDKNRVVRNASVSQNVGVNNVVKKQKPLYLIEGIFENHGAPPQIGDIMKKYQFPVEIGCPIDKNYDGKNSASDLILNDVYDTIKSTVEETEQNTKDEESREEEVTTESMEFASGDATEETKETEESTEEQTTEENEALETYRKDVWKQIMKTETIEVEVTEEQGSVLVEEKEEATAENMEFASGDAAETEEEQIATGYYIIKGTMCKDSDVFVSDIEIIPAGLNGFDKVRIGEDGEFTDKITITKDGLNQQVELYFTNGEHITEATTFSYSKDTSKPELTLDEESIQTITSARRTIYLSKDGTVPLLLKDGEENIKETLDCINILYGDHVETVTTDLEASSIKLEEDFYGRILLNCYDKVGNVSQLQSAFILIDQNKPEIIVSEDALCTTPYTLWVNVLEKGHIVSGIQTIQCVVNGTNYDVTDSVVNETYQLDEELEVSSKITFPIELNEKGIHAIYIRVVDYAGNETVIEKNIEVKEPELVSVYMPRNFTIHIDPQQLAGKEQIYSDNVELKNVSQFDVRVNIDKVVLNVNDEVSADGILKDCDIYFVAPDTGEKIKLSKGDNDNVYSYRLPVETVGDLANIRFVGTTTAGSERLWKGSDISLSLQVSFVKWEEKEE